MEKNKISELILGRRSVYPKDFLRGEKIPDDVIKEILSLAVWAPTHKLTQPWFFRVFKEEGLSSFFEKQKEIYINITAKEKVTQAKLNKYDDKKTQVSHVIAVCASIDEQKRIPEIEEIAATSCVIQNIYLMLNSFRIAGYLSTGDVCYTQQMREYLQLKENEKCLGFFQLGIGIPNAELPKINRKRINAEEKTIWITQ